MAWGAVSDRALSRGRKPLLLVLTAACLVGALGLFLVPQSASTGEVAGLAVLAGLTLIGYQGLWVTMVAESAGPARVGAATGLAVTFVTISIALSPPFYGLISDIAGTLPRDLGSPLRDPRNRVHPGVAHPGVSAPTPRSRQPRG